MATDAKAQEDERKYRKTAPFSSKRVLLVVGVLSCTVYALVRGYNALELAIKDPFTEALLLPHRYLRVRFWQDPPSQIQRTFRITTDNAFVIHLEQDTDRWQRFLEVNTKSPAIQLFQTFPAFEWTPNNVVGNDEKETDHHHHHQQVLLEERYPSLHQNVQEQLFGDAGCSASHLLLLERFLASEETSTNDYIYVLEDDAKLLEPLATQALVTAPADADVVFLMPSSTKRVKVPYYYSDSDESSSTQHSKDAFAVRVIGGWGAYGYVITRQGAKKLLKYMDVNIHDPFDVAMTRAYSWKIYHSTNKWPQVQHVRHGSTRRNHNGER
jgi:GR25 family glycosyltransferase involved in LPS biosynthesis